jgi:hypothetical protein
VATITAGKSAEAHGTLSRLHSRPMATSDVIATASGALALVAIVVSVLVARSQSALAHREHLLPVVSDLLRDFLTPEFKINRVYIERTLRDDNPHTTHGLRGLSPEALACARPVIAYFNNVGLLVVNETVSAQLVSSVMGGSVVNAWRVLGPYIYAERILRGGDPNYYGYFEHLAVVVNEIGPRRLEEMLKLRKWPPAPPQT